MTDECYCFIYFTAPEIMMSLPLPMNMHIFKPYIQSCLLWGKAHVKTAYYAGTCSALNAVAQASDTATAAAGAAAAAVAGGECATSNFVAATASATAAAAAYVNC